MNVTDLFQNSPDERQQVLSELANGASRSVPVILNREHELKLYCGATLLHTFVCTPSSLGELCVGWLMTEGYSAHSVEVAPDGCTAAVHGSSGQPTEVKKLCLPRIPNATTDEMLTLFRRASDKYDRSHGVHECVIKGDGWHILRTDIGRHNAMDKAVGAAILSGYDLTGATLFSSGRINVQAVKKAVRCGIGCLMSKAVITHDALALAHELGLTVFFSVNESRCITQTP